MGMSADRPPETEQGACCAPATLQTCCASSDKADCCGHTDLAPPTCGCQH